MHTRLGKAHCKCRTELGPTQIFEQSMHINEFLDDTIQAKACTALGAQSHTCILASVGTTHCRCIADIAAYHSTETQRLLAQKA